MPAVLTAEERRLAALLAAHERVLVFTGAGISTPSGIPDFRGPQGVWTRRQPVLYDEFLSSAEKRTEYWDYKLEGHEAFRDARPNAAHHAIRALELHGRVAAIVTQNIDGLHQAAGSSPGLVVELHGTNRAVECVTCGRTGPVDEAMEHFRRHRSTPTCTCGGWLKCATISFGQPLRREVLERAVQLAGEADLVLALGSTLSVHPAASIPLLAARRGVPYAIVNRGPTDHDGAASLRIEGDVADVLPRVVASLTLRPVSRRPSSS